MCVIFLTGDESKFIEFSDMTFKLLIGILTSVYFAQYASAFINTWYGNSKSLYKFSLRNDGEDNSK